MAYTEGILRRYAESIEDPDSRREFQEAVDTIEFDDSTGVRACVSIQAEEAIGGSPVAHLLSDLEIRGGEFWDETDFENQKSGTIPWQRPAVGVVRQAGEAPKLTVDMFPGAEDGGVVAEGRVCLVLSGGVPGYFGDCEFLQADDGRMYYDNHLFMGVRGFCKLIRDGDQLIAKEVKPVGSGIATALKSKLETDGHGDGRKARSWLEAFYVQATKEYYLLPEARKALAEVYEENGWHHHASLFRS
jgi:hypothetical protein